MNLKIETTLEILYRNYLKKKKKKVLCGKFVYICESESVECFHCIRITLIKIGIVRNDFDANLMNPKFESTFFEILYRNYQSILFLFFSFFENFYIQ